MSAVFERPGNSGLLSGEDGPERVEGMKFPLARGPLKR